MRRAITAIVAAALLLVCGVAAQQARQQDIDLQAAQRTETVDGDLNAAIKQYSAIVSKYRFDHAVSATALVRMAECYQKLGDVQSRSIYERIVREFPDRPNEVALARARLSGTVSTVASAKGDRAVWTGPGVDWSGRVSSDGKFLSYVDWNDGRLMIRDIAANVNRALTPAAPNYSEQAEMSAISSDGKQIVYDWLTKGGYEFRIAILQESGFVEPRRLNGGYFNNLDWSPDGKWIAAVGGIDQKAAIGVIAVADGSFRILKSVDRNVLLTTNNKTSIRLSPDGRYIAYDRPAADATQRDVFVLAVNGSPEIPAVVHSANDAVMAWSPDGSRLLFSSDRTGSVGLWGLPFANGKVQGPPELLKSDIGPSFSLGLTASGALYVHKAISTRDVSIAPIDLDAGKLLGPPVGFTQGFVEGARNPFWSPDGKYLAYPVTCNNGCIAIRSVATGQVRRVASNLISGRVTHWSPDGRSLLASGVDRTGNHGIFQIDVRSGEATAVASGGELGVLAEWSPDGKKVYFNRDRLFVERDLASGVERKMVDVGERFGSLSPDGQNFAVGRADRSTNSATVLLVPVAGGQPREVLRLPQGESMYLPTVWTPDSRALIIQKNTGSRWELWWVPVDGRQPRKLDIDPIMWREGVTNGGSVVLQGDNGFSLSPDGRSIALMIGKTVTEIWALENFLPAPIAKK